MGTPGGTLIILSNTLTESLVWHRGPLLIHGPTSGNWDEELEPIIISDWIHANPYQTFLLETMRKAPQLDSIVVNGHGKFICDKTDPKCIGGSSPYTGIFKKGKRYLLRLVNTSTESTFIVSLDKHILEVVSNDLVAIEPYKTKSLHLGIGQRYSVIVEADPTESTSDGAYWLRTTVAQGCGDVTQRNETTAVIRYDEKSTNLPTSHPWNYSILCQDEPYENLKPIVPWEVASSPANADDDPYRADLNVTYPDGKILDHWRLANHTLWIDYSDPTILDLDNATWNPSSNVAEYDYDNKWVYIVLQANWTKATADFLGGLKNHPIHLHGHDFAILAQSNETYDEIESTKKFNFLNPPRRDSALLPINGYLAIAFKTDNPGVWLLHCHLGKISLPLRSLCLFFTFLCVMTRGKCFAWHIANGLGVQILERQYDIDNALGSLDSTKEVCTAWNSWFKDNPFEKLDSGL
ncbi:MAG: hypothetical protein M1825_004355 [Sarcosagium campestre]|nr:MAG: hypothetical protein M1825_004355 [Sarcosagium campestre]